MGIEKLLFVNVTKWKVKLTLRLENNLWGTLETENLNTSTRRFCLIADQMAS